MQFEILVVFCLSVNLQALRTEYQDEFALSTSPWLSSETRRFWLDLFAVVFWSECLANPEKSKLNKCPFMVRIVLLDEKNSPHYYEVSGMDPRSWLSDSTLFSDEFLQFSAGQLASCLPRHGVKK